MVCCGMKVQWQFRPSLRASQRGIEGKAPIITTGGGGTNSNGRRGRRAGTNNNGQKGGREGTNTNIKRLVNRMRDICRQVWMMSYLP